MRRTILREPFLANMNQKNAVLLGYHGHSNLGDDIFFAVICRWLAEDLKISNCHVQARKGADLPTDVGLKVSPFGRRRGKITRLQWIKVLWLALQADVVVFAAGSIFTVQPFFLIYCVLRILRAIRGKGAKVFAVGVSVGPFKSPGDEKWCRRALRLMDAVVLREPWESGEVPDRDLLKAVVTSYDLALGWCLRSGDLLCRNPTAGMLGVVVTERAFGTGRGKGSGQFDVLCAALQRYLLVTPRGQVRIFVVCTDRADGDQALSQTLLEALGSFSGRVSITEYRADALASMVLNLMECEKLIASRMHAGVLAVFAGIPTLQISYSSKIANFFLHSGLNDVWVIDHERLASGDLVRFIFDADKNELNETYRVAGETLAARALIVRDDLRFLAQMAAQGAFSASGLRQG